MSPYIGMQPYSIHMAHDIVCKQQKRKGARFVNSCSLTIAWSFVESKKASTTPPKMGCNTSEAKSAEVQNKLTKCCMLYTTYFLYIYTTAAATGTRDDSAGHASLLPSCASHCILQHKSICQVITATCNNPLMTFPVQMLHAKCDLIDNVTGPHTPCRMCAAD